MSGKPQHGPRSARGLLIGSDGMDKQERRSYLMRCRRAEKAGLPKPPAPGEMPPVPQVTAWESREKETIRQLQTQVQELQKKVLDHSVIRHELIGLAKHDPLPPEWLLTPIPPPTGKTETGVPSLFLSDWHWSEVVDPNQISGVNKYDLTIAKQRVERLLSNTVSLLRDHMVNPVYPGIVVPLGGDMLSGEIHEELARTNELPTIPALLDLWAVLKGLLTRLADEFGHVHVPCVTGNHGRNTLKTWSKDRQRTSFDWLLYCFLEKTLADDPRITFQVADGPDVAWKVYGHSYLMTHGDQLGKGGDGLIGALGPIIRGDHRRRARGSEIGQPYDTLLVGHWHQLLQLQRVIANGSLKGYDEYASGWGFPFEPPRQALWITHPTRGITFQMPVQVEDARSHTLEPWVSVRRFA